MIMGLVEKLDKSTFFLTPIRSLPLCRFFWRGWLLLRLIQPGVSKVDTLLRALLFTLVPIAYAAWLLLMPYILPW
jgi:hypothetical protein